MQETISQIKDLQNKLKNTGEILHLKQKKQELKKLTQEMSQQNFWQNSVQATQISQRAGDLQKEIDEFKNLEKNLTDLLNLAQTTSDKKNIPHELTQLNQKYSSLEFKTLLSKKHDPQPALLSIHAGAGGTDAQDWAEMLARMYFRYCENKNFKVNILNRQTGGEAGIKSIDLEIIGNYAYGYLKSEAGVHRLVRISPFDAEKMRHTSFALVEVLPEISETEEIEIKDADLKIDTFKSSGHGGQSVNTTDSAVRIKHLPTGIVVTCQNERSQLQNRQTALKILKSKIKQYSEVEIEEERQRIKGEFSEAAWGNQIRSYVLHPYKLAKDHRTNYETQDVEKVLDGNLDEFISAYLKWNKK